jgi:hypothetical protein
MENLEKLTEICNVLVRDSLTHRNNILISARLMETVYQLMKDDSKREENSRYITKEIEYLKRNADIVSD